MARCPRSSLVAVATAGNDWQRAIFVSWSLGVCIDNFAIAAYDDRSWWWCVCVLGGALKHHGCGVSGLGGVQDACFWVAEGLDFGGLWAIAS